MEAMQKQSLFAGLSLQSIQLYYQPAISMLCLLQFDDRHYSERSLQVVILIGPASTRCRWLRQVKKLVQAQEGPAIHA